MRKKCEECHSVKEAYLIDGLILCDSCSNRYEKLKDRQKKDFIEKIKPKKIAPKKIAPKKIEKDKLKKEELELQLKKFNLQLKEEARIEEEKKQKIKIRNPKPKNEEYEELIESLKSVISRKEALVGLDAFTQTLKNDDKMIREWKRNNKDEKILMKWFEEKTGKHAIWRGKTTKSYEKWKKDTGRDFT